MPGPDFNKTPRQIYFRAFLAFAPCVSPDCAFISVNIFRTSGNLVVICRRRELNKKSLKFVVFIHLEKKVHIWEPILQKKD